MKAESKGAARKLVKASAEAALQSAIDGATASLQSAVLERDRRIAELERLLAQIAGLAGQAPIEPEFPLPPRPQIIPTIEEAPIPEGQAGEVSDEDDMGDGRWV